MKINILILICIGYSLNASSQVDEAFRIADSLYALGDYSKAISHYEKASSSQQQLKRLAKSYEALGNKTASLQQYEQLIGQFEAGPAILFDYAKLLGETTHLKKADSIFENLSQINPTNPNLYYQRGLLFEKNSDSIAHKYFIKAFELDPGHLNAAYKIAKRNVEKRQFDSANDYILKGLKTNAQSTRFLTLSALSAYHTQNYHEAVLSYKKLVDQGISNIPLHENLAISYGRTNQFELAIEQFKILINNYEDESPKYHYNIGKSFMAVGNFEDGQRHVEIAIALQELPLDAEYVTLAASYNRQDNFLMAMKYLRRALSENPENVYALYQLAVAADNNYKDKNKVIPYYERFLTKYGTEGRYSEITQSRLSDIKKELHFKKD